MMYKYIHFGFEIILRNKILFLILVLQLSFMEFFVLDNVFEIHEINYVNYVTNGITETNFAYYAPIDYKGYNIINGTNIKDENPYINFSKLKGLVGQENVYSLYSYNEKFEMRIYPDLLTKMLKVPVKKGCWLSKASKDDNIVNCVTSNPERKIGEILTFKNDDYHIDIQLKVVGIASEPYLFFDQYQGGSSIAMTSVFSFTQKNQTDFFDVELLWIDDTDIFAMLKEHGTDTKNRLLFFENISCEEMNENIRLLKENGDVLTRSTSFDKVRINKFIKENLPITLCIFGISLVGFCCALIILMENANYVLAICKICGANLRQIKLVCVFFAILSIGFDAFPYIFIIPFACNHGLFLWTYSYIKTGFIVLVLSCLFFFLISAVLIELFFSRKNNTIIDGVK